MEKSDSFPFYVSHWRDSETRMRLTLEERGLYLELLIYASSEGSLPLEMNSLAKIAGCSSREVRRMWDSIATQFVERNGRYHNAKVDKVLQEQELYLKTQAEHGRKGAEKRWGAYADPMPDPNGVSIGYPNGVANARAGARAHSSFSSSENTENTENTEQSSRATRARGATSTDMERICREAAERHPNRNRSASPDQICQALLSNGHSDADSLAKFESWSVEYAEETEPKFSTKILELIARQAYMIQPKQEESIYPDFTPRPNGGG